MYIILKRHRKWFHSVHSSARLVLVWTTELSASIDPITQDFVSSSELEIHDNPIDTDSEHIGVGNLTCRLKYHDVAIMQIWEGRFFAGDLRPHEIEELLWREVGCWTQLGLAVREDREVRDNVE